MRAVFGSIPYPDRKEISRKSPKPTASTLSASEIALRATPQERGKAKKNIGSQAENTRNPTVIKLQWDILNFYLVKLSVHAVRGAVCGSFTLCRLSPLCTALSIHPTLWTVKLCYICGNPLTTIEGQFIIKKVYNYINLYICKVEGEIINVCCYS